MFLGVFLSQSVGKDALQQFYVRRADFEFLGIKSFDAGGLLPAKVAFVSLHSHDFARAGYSEPSFGPLMGFHLRHDLISSPIPLSLFFLVLAGH